MLYKATIQRGVEVGGEWQVKHTTFTQETRLHTPNHMDLVPKFNLYIVRLDWEPLCATYTEANDKAALYDNLGWEHLVIKFYIYSLIVNSKYF